MSDAVEMAEAADSLNDAWGIAEKFLADLHLGVSASVPMEEEMILFFKKQGSEWGLFIETPFMRDSHEPPVSIYKSSKRLRLLAVSYLDAIYNAMFVEADEQRRRMRDAEKTILSWVEQKMTQK